MSRNKLIAILTAVSVSACLYACGSDDDSNPATGGAAGHATGGKGSGGSGKGGSGNVAGKNSGGSGNEAGESAGGEGGTTEAGGGAGGDQGMAGDTGLGGAGDAAGAGGAPPAALTLAEACAAACTPAHTLTSCTTTQEACVTSCSDYASWLALVSPDDATAKELNDDYLAYMTCAAQHLPNNNQYSCNADPTINKWSPVAATQCEAALCKWTCADSTAGVGAGADAAVYARCGCT